MGLLSEKTVKLDPTPIPNYPQTLWLLFHLICSKAVPSSPALKTDLWSLTVIYSPGLWRTAVLRYQWIQIPATLLLSKIERICCFVWGLLYSLRSWSNIVWPRSTLRTCMTRRSSCAGIDPSFTHPGIPLFQRDTCSIIRSLQQIHFKLCGPIEGTIKHKEYLLVLTKTNNHILTEIITTLSQLKVFRSYKINWKSGSNGRHE